MIQSTKLDRRIASIRAFNRFHTRHVGALNETLANSGCSLTETRVLYEIAHAGQMSASNLVETLSLDPGHVSRTLKSLKSKGLVETQRSSSDGRVLVLSLTIDGQSVVKRAEAQTRSEIAKGLSSLGDQEQARLIHAMHEIRSLIDEDMQSDKTVLIRPHRPGDIGWVIHRHAALYNNEYGWDVSFEAMVAEIAGQFLRDFDPDSECCWIAEHAEAIAGSVFVVRSDERIAKLRMLYVEPTARGLGLGRRLVQEAMRFARSAGYQRMTLWTNDVLTAARTLYETEGFALVATEPHTSFGKSMVGEVWERDL